MKKVLLAVLLVIAIIIAVATPYAVAEQEPAPETEQTEVVQAESPTTIFVPVEKEDGINLTAIINSILVLIAAFITKKVIPYMKARMTAAQYAQFEAAVRVGVYAAEEIYKSGHGEEKLNYVIDYLDRKGFSVDIDQIKAAVYQMREGKTTPATVPKTE